VTADRVLKVIPGPQPEIHTIGDVLRSGSHRTDGKYKYLGGAVGADGKIYFFPSDSDFVLQVDVSVVFLFLLWDRQQKCSRND
jgi:hypothetical protein